MRNKIKKYLYVFLLIEILFSYGPAFAQELPVYDYGTQAGVSNQIREFLCAPSEPVNTASTGSSLSSTYAGDAAAQNANQGDLYRCINQLYKFSIILASVVGVFFIVIAGYVYMSAEGNQEQVEKAKSILTTTIASLVILLSGFVLLKAINPDLIQFHSIQPLSVVINTGGPSTGASSGSGSCSPVSSGPASVAQLQQTCFSSNPFEASGIANAESGGDTTLPSGVDICEDQNGHHRMINGGKMSVSWGLYQINLTAHKIGSLDCPTAFDRMYTGSNHKCNVVNVNLYNQCVAAAQTASQNIQVACLISGNGNSWSAWGANSRCHY